MALQKYVEIIDVRSRSEFEQGHLDGSKNIPLQEINLNLDLIRKWNKPIVTVCQTGTRSDMAKTILQSAGIEAHNGGAWTSFKKFL